MGFKAIVNSNFEKWGHSGVAFVSFVAKDLLLQNDTFGFLANKAQLIETLDATGKEAAKGAGNFFQNQEQGDTELLTLLGNLAKAELKFLSCNKIDEHAVLLGALKYLDQEAKLNVYQKVLRSILGQNLHKSESHDHQSHYFPREKVEEEIVRLLYRRGRKNLLVVGASGVGKTSTLKHAIERSDEFDLIELTTQELNENDNLAEYVIDRITSTKLTKSKIVFFLDEIFSFKKENIEFLLGGYQVVATANEASYKLFTDDFLNILNRFEVFNLTEPDKDETLEILKSCLHGDSEDVQFEQGFAKELYTLAKQYFPEQNFPAKGLLLIDECRFEAEKQHRNMVHIEDLLNVVSKKKSIPVQSLKKFDTSNLGDIGERLGSYVKGQEHAVDRVAATIQRSMLGFKKPTRPIGSFLFVGPSGVGKTELAKAISKELFKDEEAMVRLDMSEYAEQHTVQRMIGSPPGYIGFEEGGQLTNPIKEKPHSLVLMDEIEKAHPKIFDVFLQVLDDGRLTDGKGTKVDFSNTVVVATSNAGIEDILDLIEEGKSYKEIQEEIKEILIDYFRIEFINRFDEIIIFNALSVDALEEIAYLHINKLVEELALRRINFFISPDTVRQIAVDAYDPKAGARGLTRLVQQRIENKLADMLINGELKEGDSVSL